VGYEWAVWGELAMFRMTVRERWKLTCASQPCIGIARLKRWKRANMLGLKPPIEILAVLLKQMDAGDVKSQRAHVDDLLSSKFVAEP
jgi:DNA polymerase delta subunit 4